MQILKIVNRFYSDIRADSPNLSVRVLSNLIGILKNFIKGASATSF